MVDSNFWKCVVESVLILFAAETIPSFICFHESIILLLVDFVLVTILSNCVFVVFLTVFMPVLFLLTMLFMLVRTLFVMLDILPCKLLVIADN